MTIDNKFFFIPSIGTMIPRSALISVVFEQAALTEYEVIPSIDEHQTNPMVATLSGKETRCFLQIRSEYVPHLLDKEATSSQVDEDGNEIEAEDEVGTPEYVRIGIALSSDLEKKPEVPMSNHPVFIDVISVLNTDRPKKEKAAARYDQQAAKADAVLKNLRILSQSVSQYHSLIANIGGVATNNPLDALLPSNLQDAANAIVNQSMEAHNRSARAQADEARARYDKLISWFERNVFKRTIGEFAPANLAASQIAEIWNDLTESHLIPVTVSE